LISLGVFSFLIIGLIIGGYFYFSSFLPTEDESSADKYSRIATLTIVNQNLDSATKEKFSERFAIVSERFLQSPEDIAIFFQVNEIGRIKQNVGDYSGSEEAFLHAYKLDPGGYIINGNIASLYHYGIKDYRKAEKFYLDTLAIEGILSGNLYTYFAETYELYFYRMEDTTKAEALLERALIELPDNVSVLSLAAEHYKRIDNKSRARELYNEMLILDPTSTVALQGLESLN